MGGGDVKVGDRTLSALKNANDQLRNAIRFKQAPGVVIIVPGPYAMIDDLQIASGTYGQLAVPINLKDGKAGALYHGPNCAFQQNKNRHVSAAIHLGRNGRSGTYFPNPYARYPLGKGAPVFKGLECYPPATALCPD